MWLHSVHDIILHNKFNINYNNVIENDYKTTLVLLYYS
jgi:hypothetical protein